MRRSAWLAAGAAALLAAPAEAAHVVGAGSLRNVAASQEDAPRQLRVCNAFAFKSGLNIYHLPRHRTSALSPAWNEPYTFSRGTGEGEDMLTNHSGPLTYAQCKDFSAVKDLGPGSLINFRFSGGLHLGGFEVQEATAPGALLQIVVFRYDSETTAPKFASHVFSPFNRDWSDPEIATLDTYRRPGNRGNGRVHLEIFERGIFSSSEKRHENVDFGRVVAVKPGTYEWIMQTEAKAQPYRGYRPGYRPALVPKGACSMWLKTGQRYTVIRVGNEAKVGPTYPEELIAFPDTWARCGSAVGACRVSAAAAAAVVLAWSMTGLGPAGR